MPQNKFHPDFIPPPGDTIQETLEVLGMSQADLADRMHSPLKNITQIIQGKAPITRQTALALEHALNVPAHFWSNLEQNHRNHLARTRSSAM